MIRPAGRDFRLLWLASGVSAFGAYITTVAIGVLIVLTLGGDAADVGFVNAARWLPYLLVGLVVGALIDRRRRRPVLIGADYARAVLLGAITLLALTDRLSVLVLAAIMVAFGLASLIGDAAGQSFVPTVVPRADLQAAHARIDTTDAVAQTTGPAAPGALVAAVTAPMALLVDAATFVFSAVTLGRIRTPEAAPVTASVPHLGAEIRDGLRWVYRHCMLAPRAFTGHAWFFWSAVLGAVYVPYVVTELGLSSWVLGLTLAATGVGAVLGAAASSWAGRTWGAGPTVIVGDSLAAVAVGVLALAPAAGGVAGALVLGIGQWVYGAGIGIGNSNDMAFRQAVTPDELQGRMNATIRSINRAMIVIGAPLGGVFAVAAGNRTALWVAAGGFLLTAVALTLSPYRHARHVTS